jgi:hypothetical protein
MVPWTVALCVVSWSTLVSAGRANGAISSAPMSVAGPILRAWPSKSVGSETVVPWSIVRTESGFWCTSPLSGSTSDGLPLTSVASVTQIPPPLQTKLLATSCENVTVMPLASPTYAVPWTTVLMTDTALAWRLAAVNWTALTTPAAGGAMMVTLRSAPVGTAPVPKVPWTNMAGPLYGSSPA